MIKRGLHIRLTVFALGCVASVACGNGNADAPEAAAMAGSTSGGSGGVSASRAGASGNQPSGAAGELGSAGSGASSAKGGAQNGGGGGAQNGGAGGGGATNGGAASAGTTNGGGTFGGSAGGGASAAPWQFPAGVSKPRIMIVGDSISAGPGCYKKYLLQDLKDNDYSSFEFVGKYADDCGGFVRHSAVSCSTAEEYTHATFTMQNCSQGVVFDGLASLMTSQKPDLVMLQLGVNDVWGGASVAAILASYTTLVQQARAANPAVVLVVAEIQKIDPNCSTDPTLTNQARALDDAVPAWAKSLSTGVSPVFTANLWSNSDSSKAETIDCVHPNDLGAQKMGMNWFNALKGILKRG